MASLEYFEVECFEDLGAGYYKQIASDVLQDLGLIGVIARLHIYIDPKVPVFVAVGVSRKLPGQVRLRDFAIVNVQEQKTIINISEEKYLADLLRILWQKYTSGRVEQPDRFTVVINAPSSETGDLEDLFVANPNEAIFRDIIYAMQYIAPEGFKVRRQLVEEQKFYFAASEDTLDEHIIDAIVAEKFALMGVEM